MARFIGGVIRSTVQRALCAHAEHAQAVAASLDARSAESCGMPCDPYIREKFTRERSAARKLAQEYFQRISKRPISFWRHPEDNSQAAMYAELNAQQPSGFLKEMPDQIS
jgi:hypothetical protein